MNTLWGHEPVQDELELIQVLDEKDFRPHPMRTCRTLLDANNYVISATRFKTHDRVVARPFKAGPWGGPPEFGHLEGTDWARGRDR